MTRKTRMTGIPIVTGRSAIGSLISSLSLVTVPEVFAKVKPAQVSFSVKSLHAFSGEKLTRFLSFFNF